MDRTAFGGNILTQIMLRNASTATHFCGLPAVKDQYIILEDWSRSSNTFFPPIPVELFQEDRKLPDFPGQLWAPHRSLFVHCGSWAATQALSCQMLNRASYVTQVDFDRLSNSPWDWRRYKHRQLYIYEERAELFALEMELINCEGYTAQEVRIALGKAFYLLGVETFTVLGLLGDLRPKSFDGRVIVPLGAVIREDDNKEREGEYDVLPFIHCSGNEYSVRPGFAHQKMGARHYVPIVRTGPLRL